ncbi:hypothetical protein CXF33_03175, partial [Corynebacterium bovis]
MSRTTAAAVDIARRMDRLPLLRSHRFMTLVVGAGLFFDCYENFLAVTIAKVLERDFALSGTTLSLVLASAFIGQFIGALLLGRLADRIGRRRAFIVNLLLYCGFSLVAAFSPSAWWLIVCRFIAGVGIGGEYALADSYLSELLPARVRGRYISWAYTVSFFGMPAVGVLALWLVPLSPAGIAGWRWLFVIGALGGVLVWWVRRAVPESPRWLALHGRVDAATRIVERLEDEARRAARPRRPGAAGARTCGDDPQRRARPRLLLQRQIDEAVATAHDERVDAVIRHRLRGEFAGGRRRRALDAHHVHAPLAEPPARRVRRRDG